MSLDLSLKNSQFNFKMDKSCGYKIYEFEDFRLDVAHLLLWHKDREINLTPKAVETLLALVERHGEVVSKDDLMKTIWSDSVVEESNLSQYLYILRKTLGTCSDGTPFIETLKRRGYRFNGDVRVSEYLQNENINDYLSPNNENGNKFKNSSTKENNLIQLQNTKSERVHNVKQFGNVLVLENWKEENVNQQDIVPSASKLKLDFRYVGLIGVAVMSLTAMLVFLWTKSAINEKNPTPKQDLIIINLTHGESPVSPAISPDGKYFVYHTEEEGEKPQMWIQQVEQANRVEISLPLDGKLFSKTFTPDSKYIYFLAKEDLSHSYSLYRIPTLGGVLTKILNRVNTSVSFSPDGREMVFQRLDTKANQTSLVIASSDGSNERTLLTRNGASEMISYSAWSPDGQTIAFGNVKMFKPTYPECTISGIDIESGKIKDLSTEKWDYCYRMDWTRDGKGLILIGTKFNEIMTTRRNQIFYLSMESGEARRLTSGDSRYQPDGLTITDDDAIVVSPYTRPAQIWAMDINGDSRTSVQITRGQTDGTSGISSLPDGRIGYLTRTGEDFDIWTINSDGSNRSQVIENHPTAEELRASPDGRYFIFAAKNEKKETHLFRLDTDGTNLKQLTFGESQELDSTVSPDSNWIIYDSTKIKGDSAKTSLWKMPINGGEPKLLSDIICYTPHFSPDGAFISCISDENQINILSSVDGSVVKTFEAVEISGLNVGVRWMPDGQTLIYQATIKGVGNIWKQPVDGGEPKPLTDFTSGIIYNYAVSYDGTKLYVARGYPINDAVLIKNLN